jgi:UDP-N-acetylmuramoyl-tripeptide--D-alanyl-D-alanine ligase
MKLNSKQIIQATGGRFLVEPIDSAEIFSRLEWDSRDAGPGVLFAAMPGERVDGIDFVGTALAAGARGALVEAMPDAKTCAYAREMGAAIIEVPCVAHAIADIAREWRGHLKARVIGLTGSVGKTTTKNFVRDVCASQFKTVATRANQNNELGAPKTILNADPDTQVVIVEMGMRGPGQISELCDIVRPDWGIITNVGQSHIELLGSRDAIAHAKSELLDALPAGTGVAFLNAADDYTAQIEQWSGLAARGVRTLKYGQGGAIYAYDVELDAAGCPTFKLCINNAEGDASTTSARESFVGSSQADTSAEDTAAIDGEPRLFDLPQDDSCVRTTLALRGLHNVSNALAAAAVGCALGIPLSQIAQALADSAPEAGRQQVLHAPNGATIINDAYNANPESMRASLKTFEAMDVLGRRIAVLGDMGELGDFTAPAHAAIGELCARLPLNLLICVGVKAQTIADAALEAGMPAGALRRAQTAGEALCMLEGELDSHDAVLVKASHSMRLDKVAEGLVS